MEPDEEAVRRALRLCMRPIADLLIQAGVSFIELQDAAKLAYVDVANRKLGVRGRDANSSRVSAVTGISRKEVARLRARALDDNELNNIRTSPAGLVLAGWHTDADFLDQNHQPKELQFDDPENVSFVELVKRYAGDIPAGAVRAELRSAGNIEENASGQLRVLRRHFVPAEALVRVATSLEFMLHNLAATIAHNSNPKRTTYGYIERFVFSDNLEEGAIPEFRQLTRERAQALLESLDDWLADHDVRGEDGISASANKRVGLGVFYYEGPAPKRP